MHINLLMKRPLQCRAPGTFPDDFETSKQTTARQDRARIPLWSGSNAQGEVLIAAILIPA
jgi:hypothetical protein